jgi:hypothetical protein
MTIKADPHHGRPGHHLTEEQGLTELGSTPLRDVAGTPIPLRSRVEQVAVDKNHGAQGRGVVMDWRSYHANGPDKRRRKAIPATCGLHRGPIGFANFLVSMQGGTVVFDPHLTGACVIALEEEGATALRDILTEWLG